MRQVYRYSELNTAARASLCQRNPVADPNILEVCQEIFDSVRHRGDAALVEYSLRFDRCNPDPIRIRQQAFTVAGSRLPDQFRIALQRAASNIRAFHSSQLEAESPVEVERGVTCWRESRPIERVGLYVPGGSAILPSTALMLGIPARLAGCRRLVLCSPPGRDGSLSDELLQAAREAGTTDVYAVGGAQAIAAMTFGTESVPRVDKIFGPGNRYVQTAKYLASQYGVSIDGIAGPSEVLVIADAFSSAGAIAADLISQAEHDRDSRVVLVTDQEQLVREVQEQIQTQLQDLPRREIAETALKSSFALIVDTLEQGFEFSNQFAPEHLILQLKEARDWVRRVQAAGSVFVGFWSPEVAGDYASGTNHVLPTSGMARSTSGVSVDGFVNKITFQEITSAGLEQLAETLLNLARTEQLEGHARAVEIRLRATSEAPSPDGAAGFSPERLVRRNIRSLRPYQSARDQILDGILLDANENPFDVSAGPVLLNRYPDPHQRELRKALSVHLGVRAEQILCGVGSDEVLDWILRVFCEPGADRVAWAAPTYGMYRVTAEIQGVEFWEFPLAAGFDLDAKHFLSSVPSSVKVLILCSPNNPTGNLLSTDQIRTVCREWGGLVVVDEAYIEFASRPSLVKELDRHPNLAVMRTLSKAAARAGIRLGYVVASEEIIRYLAKVKLPYNLNSWTMAEACRVLAEPEKITRQANELRLERQRLVAGLEAVPRVSRVFPSDANFVLFETSQPDRVYQRLLEQGIVIRNRSRVPGLAGCLRVSLGTQEQNDLFLNSLRTALEDLDEVEATQS